MGIVYANTILLGQTVIVVRLFTMTSHGDLQKMIILMNVVVCMISQENVYLIKLLKNVGSIAKYCILVYVIITENFASN